MLLAVLFIGHCRVSGNNLLVQVTLSEGNMEMTMAHKNREEQVDLILPSSLFQLFV